MKKILAPGIVLSIYMFLLYMVNLRLLAENNLLLIFSVKSVSHFVVLLFLMMWLRKKYYADGFSFKEAFTSSVSMEILGATIAGILIFIYWKTNPEALEIMRQTSMEKGRQLLLDRTGVVPPNFEHTNKISTTPVVLALSELSTIIFGIFYSLIISAILKSKKQIDLASS